MIKKERVALYVVIALIIGFIGGVMYSAWRSPMIADANQEAKHQHETAATAIAALEKTTRNNPEDGQAWAELAHAYLNTNRAKQAIAAYTKALELLPDNLDVITDLGVSYHQDNQHQKAIELFDRVLRSNPKHEQARFNKGVVLLIGLNDPKATLAEWKILVQHHPMAAAPSGDMVANLIDRLEKETEKTVKP